VHDRAFSAPFPANTASFSNCGCQGLLRHRALGAPGPRSRGRALSDQVQLRPLFAHHNPCSHDGTRHAPRGGCSRYSLFHASAFTRTPMSVMAEEPAQRPVMSLALSYLGSESRLATAEPHVASPPSPHRHRAPERSPLHGTATPRLRRRQRRAAPPGGCTARGKNDSSADARSERGAQGAKGGAWERGARFLPQGHPLSMFKRYECRNERSECTRDTIAHAVASSALRPRPAPPRPSAPHNTPAPRAVRSRARGARTGTARCTPAPPAPAQSTWPAGALGPRRALRRRRRRRRHTARARARERPAARQGRGTRVGDGAGGAAGGGWTRARPTLSTPTPTTGWTRATSPSPRQPRPAPRPRARALSCG